MAFAVRLEAGLKERGFTPLIDRTEQAFCTNRLPSRRCSRGDSRLNFILLDNEPNFEASPRTLAMGPRFMDVSLN
jgi:hypothetical protein